MNKVKSFNEFIGESFWGDVHKRSRGDAIRKEDDINRMSCDELYDLIYDTYEQINPYPVPLKSLEDTSEKKYQYFSIPIFKANYKVYRLDAVFTNDKISTLVLMANDADIRDFKQALIDNFDVTIRSDKAITIEEKDGTLTNQTCMKLISVIVENAPEPYLIKKKGLKESFWGDVHKRSRGDEIRKEDEAFYNNMSRSEFLDYLNSKYKDKVVEIEKWGSNINVRFNSYDTHSKYGCIQMFIEFIEYPYSEENKIKRIIITSSKPNNLLKMLKTRFIVKKMYPDNWYYEEGQEKPIWLVINEEKSTVVKIFEFILNNKLNESFWGDIHKRSRGDSIRKEDAVIDNGTLRDEIKQLYKEQGEGDTLDVSSLSKYKCNDLSYLFYNFKKVKQIIGLETWDVSNATNMYCMFYDCRSLTELNISNWNVSNVTDMMYMFNRCSSLTELNISNWNVSNVTDMAAMFDDCRSLTELNIDTWDVSNVTNMCGMFNGCISLTELNIDTWDVSKVTNMGGMFDDCNKLIKPKWYNE